MTFGNASVIMVAYTTVAYATIKRKEYYMPSFMKLLNNISRSQSTYYASKLPVTDLLAGQFYFALNICSKPGRSQEEIAKDLCYNKSTVARSLNSMEINGYITRTPLPEDKRKFAVYPTKKLLAIIPEVKKKSVEWRAQLAEGISTEELETFYSVLERMEARAKEIIEGQD